MPIPMAVARFNRRVTNRVTTPVLRRLPGFGVVHHIGRRSGRAYSTPVNIFEVDGDYVVALTYGSETDWVRNVVAAGGCELEVRGRRVRCTDPRLEHDATAARIRLPERPVLRLLGVTEFLRLTPSHDDRAGSPARG